jgi:hypothetical protein
MGESVKEKADERNMGIGDQCPIHSMAVMGHIPMTKYI